MVVDGVVTIVELLAGIILLINVILLILFISNGTTQKLKEILATRLNTLEKGQERLEKALRDEMALSRQESSQSSSRLREDIDAQFTRSAAHVTQLLSTRLDEQTRQLETVKDTLRAMLTETSSHQHQRFDAFAEATQNTLHAVDRHHSDILNGMADHQKQQLDSFMRQLTELTQMNATKLEQLRATVEQQLASLQKDNTAQLEKMRATVDEKLHQTLEQRLGDSFKIVSERLEQVQKGLGEMQTLASGVGDLKKVLTNVKTRGTLGEIQLDNILEQVLTNDQYETKAMVKPGSQERVDFAIRLPGQADGTSMVLLPIDAKFPLEDYQRLVESQELGDLTSAQEAARMLEARIKSEARSIQDKYINPPATTDFAILFLPVEGLFAEVLRRPGLFDVLQREYRVIIAGPTTITALLHSLQMGFRTLAIQKRSSEVWKVLGAVKTEFGKFGEVLAKTQKKLQEASNTIDTAATRTRAIERQLKTVEALPADDVAPLLETFDISRGGGVT